MMTPCLFRSEFWDCDFGALNRRLHSVGIHLKHHGCQSRIKVECRKEKKEKKGKGKTGKKEKEKKEKR